MRIRFWGTRGSIAKPGPATVRYGGNTSCVEVRAGAVAPLVLDCGTGGHALGQALVRRNEAARGHLLISHTHWDHIQGVPFFAPLFLEGAEWDIYGPKGLSQGIRQVLAGQMEHTYFPVTLESFAAHIRYHDLVEGAFTLDEVRVVTRYLNHPALTLAYRIEAGGAVLVYACDHEPHDAAAAGGERPLEGPDRKHAEFLAGADLVVHDAQYTAREYPAKVGWGHSSAEYVLRACAEAGVRRVVLTHYDPLRDDAGVDRQLQELRAWAGRSAPEIVAATEGLELEVTPGGSRGAAAGGRRFPARANIDSALLLARPALIQVSDRGLRRLLRTAARQEQLPPPQFVAPGKPLPPVGSGRYSLVVLQHDPPALDALAAARALRKAEPPSAVQVPVAVVAGAGAPARAAGAFADWLTAPFTLSYARTRLRAWTLRTACRWVRAGLPRDEPRRLAALRRLAILDTPPDPRFDRITRIAAAAFDVPIALLSLVDRDRQWFKSCVGLGTRQTPRDAAFCAHAVERRADLVVPDTLQDDRFADNPLVVDEPRIRFYAGAPLVLDGHCLGTLCILDRRPRTFTDADLRLLHELRDLAVEELRRGGGRPKTRARRRRRA
jgi:phosphoribosyl 1,2-cyclic phosphodiesterase/CheY-like chemotaxis protein